MGFNSSPVTVIELGKTYETRLIHWFYLPRFSRAFG